MNTALEAIDKIRDTAASHDRLFIVEVMGRNTGYIALEVGLAGGAEDAIFPENPLIIDKLINKIQSGIKRGKKSSIIVTAEVDKPGYAYIIAKELKDKAGFDATVCILGHIQRGGSPTALDRMIASRFAAQAITKLLEGHCNAMIALQGTTYKEVSFDEATKKKKFPYDNMLELIDILSH